MKNSKLSEQLKLRRICNPILQIIFFIYTSLVKIDKEEPVKLEKPKKKKRGIKIEYIFISAVILLFIVLSIYIGIHGSLESTTYYYRL